jgi:hypothetical protein
MMNESYSSEGTPLMPPFVAGKPGPKDAPHCRLYPAFLREIHNSSYRKGQLASIGGFPCITALSPLLYKNRIVATPLIVRRLQRIAEAIGYTGPIFQEQPIPRDVREENEAKAS